MLRLNFKCDQCGGPVWKDIESHKHVDMCCLYCGKRWFIKKALWVKLMQEMEKKYASKKSRVGKLLVKPRANLQSS